MSDETKRLRREIIRLRVALTGAEQVISDLRGELAWRAMTKSPSDNPAGANEVLPSDDRERIVPRFTDTDKRPTGGKIGSYDVELPNGVMCIKCGYRLVYDCDSTRVWSSCYRCGCGGAPTLHGHTQEGNHD